MTGPRTGAEHATNKSDDDSTSNTEVETRRLLRDRLGAAEAVRDAARGTGRVAAGSDGMAPS